MPILLAFFMLTFVHATEIVDPGEAPTFYDYLRRMDRVTADSPYSQLARRCGQGEQAQCTVSKLGRSMCGRAVSQMLRCMGAGLHVGGRCTGRCGNGRDFVNCSRGELRRCGYVKADPRSDVCQKPGAVLAYNQSPTRRGRKYGHVEFVCGYALYCSIYSREHHAPWPRAVADACWYPDESLNPDAVNE